MAVFFFVKKIYISFRLCTEGERVAHVTGGYWEVGFTVNSVETIVGLNLLNVSHLPLIMSN